MERDVLLSPIPLDELTSMIKNVCIEVNQQLLREYPDKNKEEILDNNGVATFIKRSRQTLNKYIKQGKIKPHYLDEKSPIFLKSELIESLKSLPSEMKNKKE